MDPSLTQFYRQFLQQVNEPVIPPAKTLLNPYMQEQVYRYMFDPSQANLPPVRYRKRILKIITQRIEAAIEDPDEDVGTPWLETSTSLFPRVTCHSFPDLTLLPRRSQTL